ncbi:unnamed protein product [Dicrocoelium dendriticum]|nr:unnamed protein product [Dicrocoelium dendriticum]
MMSCSDRLRSSLKLLEANLREDHTKCESAPKFAYSDIFLNNGRKPNILEEMELLDTFASYMSTKSDEELKCRVFFELFPVEKDLSPYNMRFLTQLTSLALCARLSSILEFSGIWLKIRLCQVHSAGSSSGLHSVYQMLVLFVTSITSDLLSIPGLPLGACHGGTITKAEETDMPPDHPFLNLHCSAPIFTDAYICGVTLVYGFPPSHGLVLFQRDIFKPVGPPPVALLYCLTSWLHSARTSTKSHHSSSGHPAQWTSVDWIFLLRRCRNSFYNFQSIEQNLSLLPAMPISIALWTIFGPLELIGAQAGQNETCTRENKLLLYQLAELHCELLQCLPEPTAIGSHRHGVAGSSVGSGGSVFSQPFSSWSVFCYRKTEHTKDLLCLESFVKHASERCGQQHRNPDLLLANQQLNHQYLTLTRLAEFIQLSWSGGRIRNLSSDDFYKLLSPFAGHTLFDLIRSRVKR